MLQAGGFLRFRGWVYATVVLSHGIIAVVGGTGGDSATGPGATGGSLSADPTPCPSSFETNMSIPKGEPYVWIPGEQVTASGCLAMCCKNTSCVKWVHTTFFDSKQGFCDHGQPCCLLYSGETHDTSRFRTINVTSGVASPWRLQLSGIFSDNMVLQRAPSSAAIYGLAPPGQKITVRMDSKGGSGDTFAATTSSDGAWGVRLPPTQAGGSFTFTASCPGCQNASTSTMTNVTFGDVWVCGGQSNAWLPLHHTFGLNATLASIAANAFDGPNGPKIRMFTMPQPGQPVDAPMYVIPPSASSGKNMMGVPNVWNVPNASEPVDRITGNCDNNVFAP